MTEQEELKPCECGCVKFAVVHNGRNEIFIKCRLCSRMEQED